MNTIQNVVPSPCSAGSDQFVLKDIPELIFEHFNDEVRPNLRDSPFIRLPVDVIPDKRIFVFEFLEEDLFSLIKKQVPPHITRKILKDSLQGMAESHSQDIVHLGNQNISTVHGIRY